jgi:signal peptidase I
MPRSKSLLRTILEPLAVAIGLAAAVRAAVHIYAIPSASMQPTLESGDQIVVLRYFRGQPQRGHIVVFHSPLAADELMVKRVIGVPGDLVDSREGRVRIGGYTLAEPYVLRQASSGAIQSQIIPANAYFVMGDNRDDSLDSRSWGVVPRERIVGRARLILWSSTLEAGAEANASTSPHAGRAARADRGLRLFKWLN